MSEQDALHPFTREVISVLGLEDKRVEAHEPGEQDDDIIFLENSDNGGSGDAHALCIGTFGDKVVASFETACRQSGWAIHWSTSISEPAEVLDELKSRITRR